MQVKTLIIERLSYILISICIDSFGAQHTDLLCG